MKYSIMIGTILIALIFCGCTSSRLAIAPDVDLSAYRNVVISKTSDANSAVMFGLEIEIGNLFPQHGYKIIGDKEAELLSPAEQKSVLVVRGAMSSAPAESVCTIVLDDFSTGRTLVSARGAFGMGWNMDGDREGAMKYAMRQIEQVLKSSGNRCPRQCTGRTEERR